MYNRFKRNQFNRCDAYASNVPNRCHNRRDIITKTPNQTILSNNTYIISDNKKKCVQKERGKNNDICNTICDNIDDVRTEIKNLEYKLINRNDKKAEDNCENKIECKKIRATIENMSINTCLIFEKNMNCTTIFGNYYSKSIMLCDLSGTIKLDDLSFNSNDTVYGHITICNLDNSTVFNGIVHIADNELQYLLTNRPLIQIGAPFKGVINILVKIAQ